MLRTRTTTIDPQFSFADAELIVKALNFCGDQPFFTDDEQPVLHQLAAEISDMIEDRTAKYERRENATEKGRL
ncbi:MAG: hypothetical protein J2P56_07000 [Verrucomicrobia bacterium]|nr:hypothetical protein [Verrucomicrobiota bacterium]